MFLKIFGKVFFVTKGTVFSEFVFHIIEVGIIELHNRSGIIKNLLVLFESVNRDMLVSFV